MNVSRVGAYWHAALQYEASLAALFLLGSVSLASAQDVTIDIGSGSGTPGGTAAITVSISNINALNVSAAQVDVLFDSTALSFANIDPGSHQVLDCVADSRLNALTHSASIITNPPPPAGQSRLQLGIVSTTFPLQTFGDGPLFTCTFQIGASVAVSTNLTLAGDRPLVTDNQLNHITPIVVNPGTISVAGTTPTNTPASTPTPTSTPLSCKIDTDCPPTQICLDQVCQQVGCSVENPCPTPRLCVEGICVPPTCTTNVDCTPPAICDQGACQVVPCTVDDDCPTGNVCSDGKCVPGPTATPTHTAPPTPTSTPVTPATQPPTATATNTVRPTPTNTPSPTNTPLPPATATKTSGGGFVGLDSDGCNISPASTSSGSLLWLAIPAAVVLWRRRED